MIGVEKSQISASAAVDYSKPVQKLSYYWANVVPADNMSTVQNNWRQVTSYRNMPADADLSSFRLSAYATNNYGVDFDIWFTIIAEDTGETIYNSGWKSSPIINEPVYMYRTYSRVRCVMRIRYNDESGYSNPPSSAEFSGVNWVVNYDYYVNYSDDNMPESWLSTTTAETPTIIDTSTTVVEVPEALTTTLAPSKVDEYMTLPAKVHSALLFTLSIIGRLLALKYVTPALCLGILVALAGWLLH